PASPAAGAPRRGARRCPRCGDRPSGARDAGAPRTPRSIRRSRRAARRPAGRAPRARGGSPAPGAPADRPASRSTAWRWKIARVALQMPEICPNSGRNIPHTGPHRPGPLFRGARRDEMRLGVHSGEPAPALPSAVRTLGYASVAALGSLLASLQLLGVYLHDDDFLHLFRLTDFGPGEFIIAPYAGHMLLVRNSVFFLTFRLFGMHAAAYLACAVVTH